jgi:hypothetical protein
VVKLIVVVGLPGSGKSYRIRELKRSCPGTCVDDYLKDPVGGSPRFTDSRSYPDLVRDLRAGRDCAISDVEFCDTGRRVELEQVVAQDASGVVIEWQFFENNPGRCTANVERERGGDVAARKDRVRALARNYHIPPGGKPIPVSSPSWYG